VSRRAQDFVKAVAFPGVLVLQRPLKRDRSGNPTVPGKRTEDAEGTGTGRHVIVPRFLN
jgi:hypothetical protein